MLKLLLIVELVNTLIGTAPATTATAGLFGRNTEELGQTLPAVLEPNGMNFWTPQTRDTERKCVAPYYYNDSHLQGFRNSHWIVGGCTQDYGSFTIMPEFGTLRLSADERATPFTHDQEYTTPYYYSVELPTQQLTAEMTGRSRSAIFRFTYHATGTAYIVLTANSDENESTITLNSDGTLQATNPVHRIYQGWGQTAGFSGHLHVEVNTPALRRRGRDHREQWTIVDNKTAYLTIDVTAGDEILLRLGTSFTSPTAARDNLNSEIPHWQFDRTRDQLHDIWEQRLSLINIDRSLSEGLERSDELTNFYSALYRCSFLPRTMSDCDGSYPPFAAGEKQALLQTCNMQNQTNAAPYYDDFSMWDTFRALHPLITLLDPQRSGDMMQSLVIKSQQGGWMPIFPCWNSYTAAMIGDHCAIAIADAYLKGVRNFDINTAYTALRQNAFNIPPHDDYIDGKGRRALDSYLRYGYIPLEDEVPDAFHTREQVSRTIEYALDDYALAQLAWALHHDDDYATLIQRSRNYRNVIDPQTRWANGRYADGSWYQPDSTTARPPHQRFEPFITEGAPCHYTWFAPHDPDGLIDILGGPQATSDKLDQMFAGAYWHGNEPCHQIPFMYNLIGRNDKTSTTVNHILNSEYQNTPGGLSGNDDAGQMSAWYIFAAIGLYPMCPASNQYQLCTPLFQSVTLHPIGGKPFTIKRTDNPTGQYRLNGQLLHTPTITHNDIMQGGILEVE